MEWAEEEWDKLQSEEREARQGHLERSLPGAGVSVLS